MKRVIYISSLKCWLLMSALLFSVFSTAQNFNSRVEASIQSNDSKDEFLEVIGRAKNLTQEYFSLRYELSVIISANNKNSSKNAQSGRFTLEAYETKNLSQTAVSIDPSARTVVLLVIYDMDDKVLGTDRIVYDAMEKDQAEKEISFQKPNEGIQFTGIVTENTKTKAGKDFYDFFYQKYSLSSEKAETMIQIDEIISFGRTTRIVVKVGDKTVHQFIAQPKQDFLKGQAEEALRQLNRYFEYLKNRNEYTTQY